MIATTQSWDTEEQYHAIINECQELFMKKHDDYGSSWRILRMISLFDQLYIKAQRIRTIQERGTQLVDDPIRGEFIGIVNYSIIGIIQYNHPDDFVSGEISREEILWLYNSRISLAIDLMRKKNHDYGEAWRSMSQESFVDLILMKIERAKQILATPPSSSEGIEANLFDMLNYAVFALILQSEQATK